MACYEVFQGTTNQIYKKCNVFINNLSQTLVRKKRSLVHESSFNDIL